MDAPVLAFESDYWNGIPYGRAMRWSRCFFDFPPAWPGAGVMAFAYRAFRRGRPAGLPQWVARAREAESVGFTPDSYYLLQITLSAVDRARYPSHPDNHRTRGWAGHEERPFDVETWRIWAGLCERGSTARTAAIAVLDGRREGGLGYLVDLDGHARLFAEGDEGER